MGKWYTKFTKIFYCLFSFELYARIKKNLLRIGITIKRNNKKNLFRIGVTFKRNNKKNLYRIGITFKLLIHSLA